MVHSFTNHREEKTMLTVIRVILILTVLGASVSMEDVLNKYMSERTRFLQQESDRYLGGNLQLSDEEEQVDQILMKLKLEELDSEVHLYSHFLSSRDRIKDSQLFQIIERMPKGAVLHVHDAAMLGQEYLLGLTYLDHLYMCTDDGLRFRFSNASAAELGQQQPCVTGWVLVKKAREDSEDRDQFDANLQKRFIMSVHTDQDSIWKTFRSLFSVIYALIHFRPAFEMYFRDALEAARADGIMYVEVRSALLPLYELDGSSGTCIDTARLCKAISDKFVREHPGFLGARIIYSVSRMSHDIALGENVRLFRELRREMGDFVVGFDLVGQEDRGRSLKQLLPLLAAAKGDVPFYLHAGETTWSGATDENILDAVLLGTRRLGHAFALLKRPALAELVKERGICVEVNVISNQVLGLVRDVRNHPLAALLAGNFPVVLSSDDPGMWGAKMLSHDYYVTLVGVAGRHAGLRMLKQLALNSLQYSALSTQHKEEAVVNFHAAWIEFIRQLINDADVLSTTNTPHSL